MEGWKQEDKHVLMGISSIAPLDKYHTTCAKCEVTIRYIDGFKVHDNWYCGKCYRDMEPTTPKQVNRRGTWVDERST